MIFLIFSQLLLGIIVCDIVADINKSGGPWKAQYYPALNIVYLTDILPEIKPPQFSQLPLNITKKNSLPEEYDWRKWASQCKKEIPENGNCANSWASAPARIMTYRACQQGKQNNYSSARILACCKSCGAGCYGGYPWHAFNFIMKEGTPSEMCQLLVFKQDLTFRALTPSCRLKICNDNKKYVEYKLKKVYKVTDIMNEIYQRGPVLTYMTLYKDFFYYKYGIFKHKFGQKIGKINVILLGWGVENGLKYWIGENSWGEIWGEHGYFRIVRGVNHANVEQLVISAII